MVDATCTCVALAAVHSHKNISLLMNVDVHVVSSRMLQYNTDCAKHAENTPLRRVLPSL